MDPAIRDLFYELFVIIKDPKSGEEQLDLGVKIALEIQNKLKTDPQYTTQHLPDLDAAKERIELKLTMEKRVKEIKQTMAEALNKHLAAATWNGTGGEDDYENKASRDAGSKRKQLAVDDMDEALKELGRLKKKLKRDTQPAPKEEVANVKVEQKAPGDANPAKKELSNDTTTVLGGDGNPPAMTMSTFDWRPLRYLPPPRVLRPSIMKRPRPLPGQQSQNP
ncbi:hypothetical protein EDD36DRAFT_414410 [Exophiala viscosa]|uniref:Uncharacterized protein n=1 Tax=Exophiala viscosa TaxID=2486360 RepID=A0AAN6E649_9EURO|nr:hypothetical protein EDD36DRAFT_414410 [Exophiala viscosa]